MTEIAGERVLRFDENDTKRRYGKDGTKSTSHDTITDRFDDPLDRPVYIFDKNGTERLVTSGVLSDRELKVGLAIGHLVCDPAPRQVNGASIDVRLGRYFYHAGLPDDGAQLFNPFSQEDTYRYFGIKNLETDYKEAKPWSEVRRKLGRRALESFGHLQYLEGIPEHHPIILLRPGERVLGHTHEFVGNRPPGVAQMQARSTTGRIGISACYDAGWGDPGYVNRWTMEINNLNENAHVPLPVGYRIAQLAIYMSGPVGTEYAHASGNYQSTPSSDLSIVKANWRPWHMIPRAYTNEIELPPAVDGLAKGLQ